MRRPLTNAALARALTRYPLMSQQVTGLIHWQAVKLSMKKVPFHRKPRFSTGEGSRSTPEPERAGATTAILDAPARAGEAPTSGRTALRPLPPARRSPFTGVARRLGLWGLSHPARGRISVRLPDGTVRRGGDPATGPDITVTVNSKNLWRRLATRGRLAIGESYVAGRLAHRRPGGPARDPRSLGRARPGGDGPGRRWMELQRRRPHLPPRSDLHGAKRDIQYHYDIGNDLYALFLDPSWTYSCAFFEHPGHVPAAGPGGQVPAYRDKLGLGPDAHVLEIGCGWGGFAMHAAREWGARVTGLTLSQEQAALARERIAEAGLSDRIEILLQDYRQMEGRFTHIASIEMLEAIGAPRAAGLLPVAATACSIRGASHASRRSPSPTRPTSDTGAATTGSASTSSRARSSRRWRP